MDDFRRADHIADVDAVVITGINREQAGRGTIATALGVRVANGDLTSLWLRLRRLVVVGEGCVVFEVFAEHGLVVVAFGGDWHGTEELEPPFRGLEADTGVLCFDSFVCLSGGEAVLALISRVQRKRE